MSYPPHKTWMADLPSSSTEYLGRYAQHIPQKGRYSLYAVKELDLSDDPAGNGGCQQEIAEMR